MTAVGIVLSYVFVGGVLGVATLMEKKQRLSDESARKFIHVVVSHWILLAYFLIESTIAATVIPATFIVLNYLSYRFNLLSAMEREERRKEDLGTVYYALSLTVITFFGFHFDLMGPAIVAVLAMGWGDGLAAVFGKAFKTFKLYRMKSFAGTLTVFFFTFVIALIVVREAFLILFLVALLAAFVELYTPRGFDNLTVPLTIFFALVLLI